VDLKFYLLNSATKQWLDSDTQFFDSSVPSRRFGHGAVALNSELFIFGGAWDHLGGEPLVSDTFWGWNQISRKWYTPISTGSVPPACRFPYLFTAAGSLYLLWGELSIQNTFNPNLYKWVPSTGIWSVVAVSGVSPPPSRLYCIAASSISVLAISRQDRCVYIMEISTMKWMIRNNFSGDATIFDSFLFPGVQITAVSAVSVASHFIIAARTTDEQEFLYRYEPGSNFMKILSSTNSDSNFPKDYYFNFYYHMFYSELKIYFFDNDPSNLIFPDSVQKTFLASFDLETGLWTEHFESSIVGSRPPYNKDYQSLTLIGNRVYAFGGRACPINDGTGYHNAGCNDLNVLPFPKTVDWPRYRADWLGLYDWDTLRLPGDGNHSLHENLPLCTVDLPCYVKIRGTPSGGTLQRSGNAGLACSGSDGCIGISVENVAIKCDSVLSNRAVIELKQSSGFITGSSFSLCSSTTDGAALQILDDSNVTIFKSSFSGCFSELSGGAVGISGSSCYIARSNFVNCTAMLNGGAVAGMLFPCYPLLLSPKVRVEHSVFETCGSITGAGGCVSIDSGTMKISDTYLYGCNSMGVGGGLFVSNSNFNASSVQLISCESRHSGGALACTDSSVGLQGIELVNNTALLSGGGAYFHSSASSIKGIKGIRNKAVTKGGGMISWIGIEPIFVCADGTWEDPALPGICVNCEVGKVSSVACDSSLGCCYCEPGRFTPFTGVKT
jgi:hypothetical protein